MLGKVNGDAGDLRQGVTMPLLPLLLPVMAAAKMARNMSPHSMTTYLELKIEAVNEILEEHEGVPTLKNEYRVSVGNQARGEAHRWSGSNSKRLQLSSELKKELVTGVR